MSESNVSSRLPSCSCGADLKEIDVDSSRGIWFGRRLDVRVEWACLNDHRFVEFRRREEADDLMREAVNGV